jgi:hypothetical protein
MAFFNHDAAVVIRRGKLPHWRQEGVIYFVTFRLADSLPQVKLDCLRQEKELWLRLNPEPHTRGQQIQYNERFTKPWIAGWTLVTAGAFWRDRIVNRSWSPV